MTKPADEHRARLLQALEELERAAADNVERSRVIQERIRGLKGKLSSGHPLADLVREEQSPRAVELVTANMAALETFGAEFRAAEALALRSEGLTMQEIAELFGVTRQRISALIKQKAAVDPG